MVRVRQRGQGVWRSWSWVGEDVEEGRKRALYGVKDCAGGVKIGVAEFAVVDVESVEKVRDHWFMHEPQRWWLHVVITGCESKRWQIGQRDEGSGACERVGEADRDIS